MTRIFDIAHRYVDELAAADPNTATALGIPGHEREMTDYSPDGYAAIAALNSRTRADLEAAGPENARDRVAKDFVLERLGVQLDLHEAGEYMRGLRIIASPLQRVRSVFDDVPKTTEEEWANVAARLARVPEALASYRKTLQKGLDEGKTASKRQALEGAKQAETWAGLVEGQKSYFDGLAEQAPAPNGGVGADIADGVRGAKEAYAETARWLREIYAARASEREAAGQERYALMVRAFNGTELPLLDTYAWGWDELYRIEREMEETADRIKPGVSVEEATELLENDPARSVEGVENYRAWLQELHDEAVAAIDGRHYDIDPRIRRIEVMIPPPGSAAAAYYTGPSEDFARPGRTWWPTLGRERFPKWQEVTTAYHEGVPGHHLQVAGQRTLGDKLSRYQKLLGFVSGYGEGWALYAERLMGELGFLENPDYYMGLLSAQALRAVRVIIDIGMHLELRIPEGERFHPGEVWNHDLALEFSMGRTRRPADFMASEVVRYLGWPAQAISYKVGERKWLEVREVAKRHLGEGFDLKAFHTEALDMGPMGLAQLEREMSGARAGGLEAAGG